MKNNIIEDAEDIKNSSRERRGDGREERLEHITGRGKIDNTEQHRESPGVHLTPRAPPEKALVRALPSPGSPESLPGGVDPGRQEKSR